jgi:hypothetical protein
MGVDHDDAFSRKIRRLPHPLALLAVALVFCCWAGGVCCWVCVCCWGCAAAGGVCAEAWGTIAAVSESSTTVAGRCSPWVGQLPLACLYILWH